MQLILQNIVRFLLLVIVQIFVLNNIQFMGYINPMIYIFFIVALPIHTPKYLTLILAFVLGITIDMFSNTLGVHAFSTVLIAFFRYPILNIFVETDEQVNLTPSFATIGVGTYAKYLILIILIHHTTLFAVEAFSISNIAILIPKILISSAITFILLMAVSALKRG